jgi:crooked neck
VFLFLLLTQLYNLPFALLGMCGKENIFKGYIELELQMGEVDRCRSIYSKYIEVMPHNCAAWRNFAQLEANVGEAPRARYVLCFIAPKKVF